MVNSKRIRKLNNISYDYRSNVLYWMSRDQRVENNWALIYAQELALKADKKLLVVFNLVDAFLGADNCHFNFLLTGLRQVKKDLYKKNISFSILKGNPDSNIPLFVEKNNIGAVITDFNPLKLSQTWKENVSIRLTNSFFAEVDAHNIVPCFTCSDKMEFAAYTIRPKIKKQLSEFTDLFPLVAKMPADNLNICNDAGFSLDELNLDSNSIHKSGENIAEEILEEFISCKLSEYSDKRNDPNANISSNLSPYLHFGQISSQHIYLKLNEIEIQNTKLQDSKIAFLEELIVRKELADNFCFYNKLYDKFEGFPQWAQNTLNNHRNDKREYLYNLEELENSVTHDNLWNAAQNEMGKKGKMHSYMRMYWAKKILEWTKTPEEALEFAIYLNNKYSLDGRDPNGYAGISWSIGGTHDRAWPERAIFGKIRYMNYNGCKNKFNITKYIKDNFEQTTKII